MFHTSMFWKVHVPLLTMRFETHSNPTGIFTTPKTLRFILKAVIFQSFFLFCMYLFSRFEPIYCWALAALPKLLEKAWKFVHLSLSLRSFSCDGIQHKLYICDSDQALVHPQISEGQDNVMISQKFTFQISECTFTGYLNLPFHFSQMQFKAERYWWTCDRLLSNASLMVVESFRKVLNINALPIFDLLVLKWALQEVR